MPSTPAEQHGSERPKLPPEKGREIVGLLLLTVAILLAASLASHSPSDPSFLHQPGAGVRGVRNWIGSFGAQLSALLFGFLGFAALTLPLGLAVGAWRRLRRTPPPRVVGRGFGFALLLLALPTLLELGFGRLVWRGEALVAGGALGQIVGEALVGGLAEVGAWLVAIAALGVGLGLVVQSTLGELLAEWRRQFAARLESRRLTRARNRERDEKEKARERVVQKHLQRVEEERRKDSMPPATPAAPAIRTSQATSTTSQSGAGNSPGAAPLRVQERSGSPGFSIRKVRGPLPGSAPGSGPVDESRRRVAGPDVDLDLDDRVSAAAPGGREASVSTSPRLGSTRSELPATATATASAGPAGKPPRKQEELAFGEPPLAALPPINLLQTEAIAAQFDESELVRLGEAIRARCTEFGVEGFGRGNQPRAR